MRAIRWDAKKNEWLWTNRGVGFELALLKIAAGDILDVVDHPSARYSHQRVFIVDIGKYVYLIPFVETDKEIFLKTMIPSRKATKQYLRGAGNQ